MIAIFRDGTKQYRVEEGQTLFVDLRPSAPGERLQFDEVLSIEDGAQFRVGSPLITGAQVVAEVLAETKGPKLIFHRFRRRKHSRSRHGHRQRYTKLRIERITG